MHPEGNSRARMPQITLYNDTESTIYTYYGKLKKVLA